MKENRFLKVLTLILYIVYAASMALFIGRKEIINIVVVLFCIVTTFLLRIVNKRYKKLLSDNLYIVILLFVLFSSLLGTCYNFYDINHYDDFLHVWSGFISCTVAFSIIVSLNNKNQIKNMNKVFIFLFIFMFSMGVASLWEILEFNMDLFIGTRTQAGGLRDTVIDMIDALVGTIVIMPILLHNIKKY
ncbi:hypothetical protein [Asaccharospora irregularis]|uniref:Membrane-spanning protein n=1 Tax=Asaccharospora irregularis DSM 2635 TaxID=1121321 RepID=A0A1M5MWR5_9FIRM|nr:hypothetical protein [Asaccharospora irregularis]SHG81657.1 hypothetical protein SAMN04488530_10847 [Asaccharospora irregularis DSM 2635]